MSPKSPIFTVWRTIFTQSINQRSCRTSDGSIQSGSPTFRGPKSRGPDEIPKLTKIDGGDSVGRLTLSDCIYALNW